MKAKMRQEAAIGLSSPLIMKHICFSLLKIVQLIITSLLAISTTHASDRPALQMFLLLMMQV